MGGPGGYNPPSEDESYFSGIFGIDGTLRAVF